MTLVLVHGNPETAALRGPLVDALGRDDVVRLSPPGFGSPLPDDFAATYLAYRDWLEGELERVDGPIDLVGHDWGGCHVMNVVMHRPELVRSWASDVLGLFDPDYVWHDLAQVWQTAGDGEQLVDTMMGGTVQDRAEQMHALGIPLDIAAEIAAAQGPEMARAILALYRLAAQPVWLRRAVRYRLPRPAQGCRCWPPKTITWALMNSAGGRPTALVHVRTCSKDLGTGGWCRTLLAARRPSTTSGETL